MQLFALFAFYLTNFYFLTNLLEANKDEIKQANKQYSTIIITASLIIYPGKFDKRIASSSDMGDRMGTG